MRNALFPLAGALFLMISGTLYGVGEKTIIVGGPAAWIDMETRQGVVEVAAVRPHPVLALSSERNGTGFLSPAGTVGAVPLQGLDLALSFDEGTADRFRDRAGHYGIGASPAVSAIGPRWARAGSGAAYFNRLDAPDYAGPLELKPLNTAALFGPGQRLEDFSIEFWLCPMTLENGEQVLNWSSSRQAGQQRLTIQVQCAASRNRLQWTFTNFFSAPSEAAALSFTLTGLSPVTPRNWSHHLIRFDAAAGLLEYLVNGAVESIRFTTASGREGGEVYTPLTGLGGSLTLGGRYSGLMDEFRVYSRFVEAPVLRKYPGQEGRAETRFIDLGEGQSQVVRVEAFGGRAAIGGRNDGAVPRTGARTVNEYGGAGKYRFADDAALQFFIRAGDSPYTWSDRDWRPFEPGKDLSSAYRGRYIQLAAVFYPSGDGESTPYLEELRIVYLPDEPPPPPTMVSAVARDGAVELSWRGSPDPDTAGYLVYYGASRGEYFGKGAAQGPSPVDAGNRTTVRIGGLRNGVLYYFAVAAYDRLNPFHAGEFSQEVSARPLQAAE